MLCAVASWWRGVRSSEGLAAAIAVIGTGATAALVWDGAMVGQRHKLGPGVVAFATVVGSSIVLRAGSRRGAWAIPVVCVAACGVLLFPFAHAAVAQRWARDEGRAAAAVAAALDDDAPVAGVEQRCRPWPRDIPTLRSLGADAEVCVLSTDTVTLLRNTTSGGEGVVYSRRGDPAFGDSCTRHLSGSWWEMSTTTLNCPDGFTFHGGG
jgi:hypothetical protein